MYLQGPQWRKNVQKIIDAISRLPVSDWRNRKLAVAFSGGMDSLFLLLALKELQKKYGYTLLPVYIDHGFLAEDSLYGDVARIVARKIGLNCRILKSEAIFSCNNLEEQMRIERYRQLKKFLQVQKAEYIVVAHHADDQAETILANLIRGCGIAGLAGMAEVNGVIFRPLLKISKGDIRSMILATRFPYYEDKLNYSKKGRRNQLRNTILPLFERTTGVSLAERLLTLGENMTDINDFFLEEENRIKQKICFTAIKNKAYEFSRIEFLKLPIFWRRATIKKLFFLFAKSIPSRKDILKIDSWIEAGRKPKLNFKKITWERTKDKKIILSDL